MLRFLITRPIAVLMAFTALVILGLLALVELPVSLLPDVAIPRITVQVSAPNTSARDLEQSAAAPLRRQLMQVAGLADIQSQARDGVATIELTMRYGVNTDLAFIEVNEKIDAALPSLPAGMPRPQVVKASATDIPVVYIQVTPHRGDDNFSQISDMAVRQLRPRLEQLDEVAMADITGTARTMLQVTPDRAKMQAAGITNAGLERVLQAHNLTPAVITVNDGAYRYNIRLSGQLTDPAQVAALPMRVNGRMLTLGQIADVTPTEQQPQGLSTYRGQRSVTLALIKKASAGMDRMDAAVDATLADFARQYPQAQFTKTRNQTALLDFTISNLEQNLLLGLLLVFVVCAVFMRNARLPAIIGLGVVVAVILTFLFFYLLGMSLNIVSLAGLILAVGMMIDNMIIVTDNITQHRRAGLQLAQACAVGTGQMIAPMLSSTLTTVAVFVPLVFISGIAGAIFADQALSITAGLAASYVVSITFLPVVYKLLAPSKTDADKPLTAKWLIRAYDGGVDWIFAHKTLVSVFVLLLIASIWPLYRIIDQQRMPDLTTDEAILTLDWNQNVNLAENRRQCDSLMVAVAPSLAERSASIGPQEFMINADQSGLWASQAQVYLRARDPQALDSVKLAVAGWLTAKYPVATHQFTNADNVFERVFTSSKPPLQAQLMPKDEAPSPADYEALRHDIEQSTGIAVGTAAMQRQINLQVDDQLMALYGIDYSALQTAVDQALADARISELQNPRQTTPVMLAHANTDLNQALATTMLSVHADDGKTSAQIPLSALLRTAPASDFKTVHANGIRQFLPADFNITPSQLPAVEKAVRQAVARAGNYDVAFTGSIADNAAMMRQLAWVMAVALVMMYFILCAQFESFVQPLIVLIEIPIDVAFALLSLWICGHTLNLMSAIGIIVTCGIVVNDSILKLDAINQLRRAGTPLVEAIHHAGRSRLNAIIMTSLTTVLAMAPVLFTPGMGSELQRPLAVAMIGSMVMGTLVSIYVIPLFYLLIYRRKHASSQN